MFLNGEYKKMIGFEGEFFGYRGKNLVFNVNTHENGFLSHDAVPCLIEVRGKPGENWVDAYANWLKEYQRVEMSARKFGIKVVCKDSVEVSHKDYKVIMESCFKKAIPECENIYGTDITETDTVTRGEDGKIISHKISAGMHIHFSYDYIVEMCTETYKKERGKYVHFSNTAVDRRMTSLINQPLINSFVVDLDNELLPEFMEGVVETPHRQKGFYELKDHGFEYRSLPMTKKVFNSIPRIAKYALSLFEKLDPDMSYEGG